VRTLLLLAAKEEFTMEGADEPQFGGDVDIDSSIVPDSTSVTNLPVGGDGEDVEPDDAGEDEHGDNPEGGYDG
jgi:hypothetical protein